MPLKVSEAHAPLGPTVDTPLLLSITIHNDTVFTCINALFLIRICMSLGSCYES